ncbi:MAG: DUF3179 domain-containing protein [Actinomycetia bacterium]|nr:DUF3179 domain-containing protein [Actinomycetes bacterium]
MTRGGLLLTLLLMVSACTSTTTEPPLPEGAAADVERAVDDVVAKIGESTNPVDPAAFDAIARHDDIRLAWIVADMGQFVFRGEAFESLVRAANALTGGDYTGRTVWKGMSDQLIADDIPQPPGYVEWKRELLITVDVTWVHFFNDPDADIDWRLITFGGVLADNRPMGSTESCACIAGLDDPPSIPAADGDWYPDHRPVLGVEVNGEFRAYPLNIMEVHELANDRLGGRRISLTYCTLCRSAVAFFVDDLPADIPPPVLRTSGLLRRSNKLVFDRESHSLVDQFTGQALSGPLRQAGITLNRITVVTSTWAEWREAHPETTLMAGKDANGANYPLDPLGERDAAGPIFPVGDVDGTLFANQAIIGTIIDGTNTVAFPLDAALEALERGETVTHAGVTVVQDGSGLRLVDDQGVDQASSQASWFAWSQTFPQTNLWPGGTSE